MGDTDRLRLTFVEEAALGAAPARLFHIGDFFGDEVTDEGVCNKQLVIVFTAL